MKEKELKWSDIELSLPKIDYIKNNLGKSYVSNYKKIVEKNK